MSTLNNSVAAAISFLPAQPAARRAEGGEDVKNLHATDRPLRSPADLVGQDARVKDLLYFAMLERGVFMARRGLVALSLPFGDDEADRFVTVLDEVLSVYREVLPPVR